MRHDAAYLQQYKAKLQTGAANPRSFSFHWNARWDSQEGLLLQYQALRATDPKEYAPRVQADCARLRRAMSATLPSDILRKAAGNSLTSRFAAANTHFPGIEQKTGIRALKCLRMSFSETNHEPINKTTRRREVNN